MGWGKPKLDTSGPSTKYFELKEGDNIFRILPPIKSFEELGLWSRYISLHYGFAGTNPVDPSKTRQKPFLCIEERDQKTKMVKRVCAACEERKANLEALEKLEAKLENDGSTDEVKKEKTSMLKQWLQRYNVDRKHYILVMNEAREVGVLKISHDVMKNFLKPRLKKIEQEDGINPIAANEGAWINFVRTGQKIATKIVPDAVYETIQDDKGRRLKVIKTAPLDEAIYDKVMAECPDLADIGTQLSEEQIAALVNGSQDPEEVDAIFAMSNTRERSPRAKFAQKAVSKPAPKPAPVEDEVDEEAALQAKLAAIQAKKAAAAAEASASVEVQKEESPAPAPASNPVRDLSNEEFLKKFSRKSITQ